MRDHDDLPYIVIERRSAGLGPFVWGALMGAAAALLLAPRSGEQTQEDLRQGVRRARSAAEDRIDAARTTVVRTRERFEDQIGAVRGRLDEVREKIETRTDRAKDIVDDGRRAARNVRAEVERRINHAKDSGTPVADTAADTGFDQPTTTASGYDVPISEPSGERFDDPTDLV